MKRIITMLIAICLSFFTVGTFGCAVNPPEAKNYTFFAPDGAPALAIAKFIKDKENFSLNANIDYSVVKAGDIGTKMAKGEGDFIVLPVNAASKLYKANTSDTYKLAGVVTNGNLYLMSSESITLDGLKGKVVGVIGQGLVPDLTFRAILSDNNLLDSVVQGETATDGKITLRYFEDASTLLPLLKQGKISIGLVPEPASTKLATVLAPEKNWVRTDIQELYDAQKKAYPQAVLMIKKNILDANPNLIDTISNKFEQNLNWIKQNTLDAVNAVNGAVVEGVTPSLDANVITSTVVDNCKIYFTKSLDAKAQVKNYIDKLIALDDKAGKTISDDFFG